MSEEYISKKVTFEDNKYEIRFKPVQEVFGFKAQPPIVGLGTTKGGKTVFAIDVMHHFAPQARYAYYISETKAGFIDTKMNVIPPYFMRDPTDDCLDVISRIWYDIRTRGEALKASRQDVMPLLALLYPDIDMLGIIDRYVNSVHFDNSNDVNIARLEILTRVIVDRVESKPEIMDRIKEQSQIDLINSMISKSTKSIVILDDLSALIEAAQKDNSKITVPGLKGQLPRGKALVMILKEMFTRARHYNCLILMFVHALNVFSEDLRSTMQSFVMFDANSANTVATLRRIDPSSAKFLRAVVHDTDIYNDSKYSYYVLYYNIVSRACCVTKAQLHIDEPIQIHPDLVIMHAVYDKIQTMAVSVPTTQPFKMSTATADDELDDLEFDDDRDEI